MSFVAQNLREPKTSPDDITVEHYFYTGSYKIRPHFNLEDFPVNFIKQFVIKIRIVLLFTFHQGYCTSHPRNVDILHR